MKKKVPFNRLVIIWYLLQAGNLIFPPALELAQVRIWPAIFGFVVSGVGINVVVLIYCSTLNPNGYGAEMEKRFLPLYLNSI